MSEPAIAGRVDPLVASAGPGARVTPRARTGRSRRETRHGYAFVLPWIIGFLAFIALPMLAAFVFTFLNISLDQDEPLRFVGLDNYARLINDKQAWTSLGITLRFLVLWVPVAVIVPLAIALALNSRYTRAAGLFRVLFFMPFVVPMVAGALMWKDMLVDAGWVNDTLRWLGIGSPPSWLHDPTWVAPGLVMIGLWAIGANILLCTAGVRSIPVELYEAARLDGAGWFAQLRNVTIPMVSPVLFYTVVLSVVEAMQYFLIPLVVFDGTGDPGGSTRFLNLYIYQTFFSYQDMSYGATLAWMLFAVTVVITVVLFRASRRFVYYRSER